MKAELDEWLASAPPWARCSSTALFQGGLLDLPPANEELSKS